MSESDLLVHPNIVFIGAAMSLQPIHSVEHTGIGVTKDTRNAAHGLEREPPLFQWMFKS